MGRSLSPTYLVECTPFALTSRALRPLMTSPPPTWQCTWRKVLSSWNLKGRQRYHRQTLRCFWVLSPRPRHWSARYHKYTSIENISPLVKYLEISAMGVLLTYRIADQRSNDSLRPQTRSFLRSPRVPPVLSPFRLFILIYPYPWLFVVIYGYLYLSIVIHGYLYLSIVIHGYL